MEHYLPEIFWHDRQGLLSVDFQKSSKKNGGHYKVIVPNLLLIVKKPFIIPTLYKHEK